MGLPNIGPVEIMLLLLIVGIGALVVRAVTAGSRATAPASPGARPSDPYVGAPCPACRLPTVPGADFCSACGARLTP